MLIIYILLIVIAIGVFLISEPGRKILHHVGKWGSLLIGAIIALTVVGGIVSYVIQNPSAQPIATKLTLILLVLPFLKKKEAESMNKLAQGLQKNDPRAQKKAYWLNKFVQAGLWFIGLWVLIAFILGFFAMLDNSLVWAALYVLAIGGLFCLIYFLYQKEKHKDL